MDKRNMTAQIHRTTMESIIQFHPVLDIYEIKDQKQEQNIYKIIRKHTIIHTTTITKSTSTFNRQSPLVMHGKKTTSRPKLKRS